jgi:hypothetical protein
MSWGGKGGGKEPGWNCQYCGQEDNWQSRTSCANCSEPTPNMTYGQKFGGKGRGKGQKGQIKGQKGAKGKYTQSTQVAPSEEAIILGLQKEISKLQVTERTLKELGDQQEALDAVLTKIKELKLQANGGVEQSRAEKAQVLLQAKNDKSRTRKWLRTKMMDLSKELADTNEKWIKQNEEIAGISQELTGLGWAAMNGDSDFEEEAAENRLLTQQLWEEQEGHYAALGHRPAKGYGKGAWMEGQEEMDVDNHPAPGEEELEHGELEIHDPTYY